MTMYHMAMPPHYGTPHPSAMHSSIFPGPLLPPGTQSQQTVQSFTPHSTAETAPASTTLHSSPVLSQALPLYHSPSQHPSVYINPYLRPHPGSMQTTIVPSHPGHHHHIQPHAGSHFHNMSGYPSANRIPLPVIPASQVHRHMLPEQRHYSIRRQQLSVDEELLEEMMTLHLGYLETEDSPHKMEQREKLEHVIMEYLSITPHTHKFTFHQVLEILEHSVNAKSNFSAHDAACGFDALAQYAANLISQPWRKEFREIKLHSGFWVHQVSSHLLGAECVLELMGYTCVAPKTRSVASPTEVVALGGRIYQDCYVLRGVLDPDLISRLALDCMIAYCECQCLNKLHEGVAEYGLSWAQILQFRQHYIGGVDVSLRHLLFTLRQRVTPFPHSASSPDSAFPASPPPIPVRHSSSFNATNSSLFGPQSSKPTTPTTMTGLIPVELMNKLDASSTAVTEDTGSSNHKETSHERLDNYKNGRNQCGGTATDNNLSPVNTTGAVKKCQSNKILDQLDGGAPVASSSSSSRGSVINTGRVPTAKLIDLDSSHESLALPSCKASYHLLPKVLPHKSIPKVASHQVSNNYSLPHENTELSPSPPQPSREALQAGTLEEHLEATLNLVKNPSRTTAQSSKNLDRSSLETWEFVYRGLEKKGYNKDIGDRGDILHEISRQKNLSDVNASSRNISNINLNLNNQTKDVVKNRPLTINQALHQFTLNETKEGDRPPSSKSCHSLSHGFGNDKRNSLYDNVSGGFETAPQGSNDSDDRKAPALRKINNSARLDNKSDVSKNNDASALLLSHRSTTAGSFSSSSGKSKVDIDTSVPVLAASKPTKPSGNTSNLVSIKDNTGWSCATCTYLNKSDISVCEMCGKSRDPGPDAKPLVSGGKQCPLCTLINDKDVEECSACGVELKGSSTYI